MSLLDSLFYKAPLTGYVQDSESWVKDLPRHELFAGGDTSLIDWSQYAPPFRWQESTMMCTAFAGCNVVSMLNKRETGESLVFSPLDLFTRSNGTVTGNTIQNTITEMQKSVLPEEDCPWVGPVSEWNPFILNLLGAYAKAQVRNPELGAKYSIKGLTYVLPDRESMRAALSTSPLIVVLNVGRGYFDNPAPPVASGNAHAAVATWIAPDGQVKLFDSLEQSSNFNGFHWLSKDFPILYAFGVIDLPNNWQELQKMSDDRVYPSALGRYGLPKNLSAESQSVAILRRAKLQNPTHAAYLLAKWDVFVMALSYGGYSIQDLLNDITSRRRGQGAIFDFNQVRRK